MTQREIIDMLSKDGKYIIHIGNDKRSVGVEDKNRIFDKYSALIRIHYVDEHEDLMIPINRITFVEIE
ncbi:MAG: hypothetical protein WCT54_03840 [Patescibacteria group bacterium]|jgi:hypothetical protein